MSEAAAPTSVERPLRFVCQTRRKSESLLKRCRFPAVKRIAQRLARPGGNDEPGEPRDLDTPLQQGQVQIPRQAKAALVGAVRSIQSRLNLRRIPAVDFGELLANQFEFAAYLRKPDMLASMTSRAERHQR